MKDNENDIQSNVSKDEDIMLEELKDAYNALMSLSKSPTHRKIALDIEKKMRKEQKEQAKEKD